MHKGKEIPGDFKRESTKEQKSNILRGIIDGTLLTRETVIRQLPFILFITLLAILYIGNRYHAERKARIYLDLNNEVKELRSEAITTSAELMSISKQSEVARLIREKGLDLQESKKPPMKIVMKKRRLEK